MNKKIKITIGIILAIILITIITIVNKKDEKTNNEIKQEVSTVTLSEVIDIQNIDTSSYKTEKNTKLEIASKYTIGKNIYELENNVKLEEDLTGKMIYVRETNTELNIFQTQYGIDEEDNIDMQITQIMEEFKRACESYINVELEESTSEELYGESTEEHEIPLSESIYYEKRLYSETYKIKKDELLSEETKTYDMNFYRTGNELTCELVYVIKNNEL